MNMIKNILVCMKAVPISVSVSVDSKYRLDREGVGLEWNPADLSALEAALRLKKPDGEVVVLTMGPKKITPLLKDLFPLGVSRAILLSDPLMVGADTFATSCTLQGAVEKFGPFDLIFCGRRAIDGETGQTASSLAARLDLPSVSCAEKIEEKEDHLVITRRMETGIQEISCEKNAVISFCEYTYPLRLPGLLAMRQAKGKEVEVYSADFLGIEKEKMGMKGSLTKVISMEHTFPGKRRGTFESEPKKAMEKILEMIGVVKG
ncbi:MAG: electron transfer flavoprotein subunit beta/FixA family protein [Clostridia bacterium]|nr:electron transfer flavoprotein subunit beta/FixA family protein [Clostridia bacterium]